MFDRQALAEGREALAAGDRATAEKCFLEVGPYAPERGPAMAELGRLYLEDGRCEEAVACLLEAANHLRESRVFKDLGDCLIVLGRQAEAEEALREALQYGPNDPETWAMLGRTLVAQERESEGVIAFERAVALDGTFIAGRYFLADALIRTGDPVRATGQLHLLQSVDPDNVAAAVLKGDLAFDRTEYRQAAAEYARAAARGGLPARGYERWARACEQLGDDHEAVRAWEQAASRDPHRPALWLAAARLCERHKLLRRARVYYQKALRDPGCAEEADAAIARIAEYYAHFDLSGQGGAVESDDDLESLDHLPKGAPPPKGPPPPPGRFGRGGA
ncbi:MAG: tetratricopeptide repeat protein [Candidatus Sericytochromatia bacterium]|nr:tetratricopeptide repeat protein [Candidatus Tanganyikabacteria bacterium]